MPETLKNYVNGAFVDASASGETSPVINPCTGETIALAPVSSAADVDAAMKAASDAFVSWSQTTPAEVSEGRIRGSCTFFLASRTPLTPDSSLRNSARLGLAQDCRPYGSEYR